MTSLIDIVVVNFNTLSLLKECLYSIRAYTPQPHQIVVVDNGSTDGSSQLLQELHWPNLKLIANAENRGYAKACNQGIQSGEAEYVLLLNSDVQMQPGWLDPLLVCLQTDPKIAVVGPKLVDRRGRLTGAGIVGSYANHWPRALLEVDVPGKYDEVEDCISVCGAAYLMRRSVLPVLGLLDENYFFYFEETDYSFRVHQAGYRVVFCPHSRLIHLLGQSCKDHQLLRRYFEDSQAYFRKKWATLLAPSTQPTASCEQTRGNET
ncbi:glycosyltransferase family 2 protein [Alicyclobacillaceae bacterium I2511]|jgi:GT2 family glycosyltransferase|nr:glycosyltransferase family 2 protein [Alicyclobacillaceae bacterium I2511]